MADQNQTPNQNPPEEEEKQPIVYASPVKRTWAWVGIVYVILVMILFTYYLATAKIVFGIGPLMLIPALAGVAVTAILRYRAGQSRGGLPVCVVLVAVCLVLIVINLVTGIPAMLNNF